LKKGGDLLSITEEVRGDIEKALRILKKKMLFEGIQKELRSRRFYGKTSVRRKRKTFQSAF